MSIFAADKNKTTFTIEDMNKIARANSWLGVGVGILMGPLIGTFVHIFSKK